MKLWLLAVIGGLFGILLSCGDPVDKVVNHHQAECLTCDHPEFMARCADGEDNDDDLLFDCDDPDCALHPTCAAVKGPENVAELCADGVDNDDNGYTDCQDFGCRPTTACKPEPATEENINLVCFDGLDNDHDGFFDCDDKDCQTDAVTVCETNDTACSDGLDNDENGFTDCGDFSCSQSDNVTICN